MTPKQYTKACARPGFQKNECSRFFSERGDAASTDVGDAGPLWVINCIANSLQARLLYP